MKKKKLATFPAGMTSWAQYIQGSVCPWLVVCTVLSVICTWGNQVTSVEPDMANPAHSVDSPRGRVAMTSQSNKATSGATSFQSINFSHVQLPTIAVLKKKRSKRKKQWNKWMYPKWCCELATEYHVTPLITQILIISIDNGTACHFTLSIIMQYPTRIFDSLFCVRGGGSISCALGQGLSVGSTAWRSVCHCKSFSSNVVIMCWIGDIV